MKKNFLIFSALAACSLTFCLCSSSKDKTNTFDATLGKDIDKNTSKPNSVDITIDASKSMKGYFLSDSPDFINSISNIHGLVSPNRASIYFVGQEHSYKGLIKDLIRDLKNQPGRGSTVFDPIIEEMCNKAKGGKVCFFVTDGIISVGNGTGFALEQLGNRITNCLNNHRDKAVAVLQYEAEFNTSQLINGERIWFYDKNDKRHALNCPNRPYYIIAVGSKENILWLSQNEQKELSTAPKRAIYFGIHNMKEHNSNKLANGNNCELESHSSPIILRATLPECLSYLDDAYVKENLTIESKTCKPKEGKGKDPFKSSSDTKLTNKNIKLSINPSDYLFTGREQELVVKIVNEIPSDWAKLYTKDDTNIDRDSSLYGKTFGLETLLKAIKKGVEPNADDIIRITYKFIY